MSNIRATIDYSGRSDAAIIACVEAAAAAQDRMNRPAALAPERYNVPKKRQRIKRTTADFTPHERALFRALAVKFPPAQCIDMVIRARGSR